MEFKLLRRIERLRCKLNRLGSKKSLVDHEVVEMSQELDELLNGYQELKRQLSFW